jgi:arylsulfatase A-like enzyme
MPVKKPMRHSTGLQEDYIHTQRDLYDRQVAQVDDEFGSLISKLDKDGILENSYLILTSDHGELFERGFVGHGFDFMYEPVIHIPLIIHAPGQVKRKDVFSLTSNIDILPTILSIAGKKPGSDMDGRVLPGLADGQADNERLVFSIVAVRNSSFQPIKKAVVAMRKHAYKLIAYIGYEDLDNPFEIYNLEDDPDELNDLASSEPEILSALKDEFFESFDPGSTL